MTGKCFSCHENIREPKGRPAIAAVDPAGLAPAITPLPLRHFAELDSRKCLDNEHASAATGAGFNQHVRHLNNGLAAGVFGRRGRSRVWRLV